MNAFFTQHGLKPSRRTWIGLIPDDVAMAFVTTETFPLWRLLRDLGGYAASTLEQTLEWQADDSATTCITLNEMTPTPQSYPALVALLSEI